MAHYLYRHSVEEFTRNGVNFKEHLYVSEVDEKNGEHFDEREDHNHVLKRITACTRAGSIPDIDLRAFVACLNATGSGLTYTALTGQHKQSVPDCERMFSRGVLEFLEANNYPNEARFVKVVRNWHKASDGRGLSEETRSQYNLAMLDFILEDWMPWHWYMRNYSVIDVNRYLFLFNHCIYVVAYCKIRFPLQSYRIITYRSIFFCVETISSTLVLRKQRNMFRYDTVEVETSLNMGK